MTHWYIPTAKSRVLMDGLGYWLQTSKTATPKRGVYLSWWWQIPTKGGLFKDCRRDRTSVNRIVENESKYVWSLLDEFRLSSALLSQLLHLQQPRNELLLFVSLSRLRIPHGTNSHDCRTELPAMRTCPKRAKNGRHQNGGKHTLEARLLHKNASPLSTHSSAEYWHSNLR